MLIFILNLLLLDRRSRRDRIAVSSLEDRADFKYGRAFDELSWAEQQELLREYRVGTCYFTGVPFGRRVVDFDPAYARKHKLATLLLLLGTALFTACHAAYSFADRMEWLRLLGSSRSLGFWLLVFSSFWPILIVLWRGPQRTTQSTASPAPIT